MTAAATASDDDDGNGDGASASPTGGDITEAPFARACERLHDECASVCDNVFIECYEDVDTCTEQWTRDYLADYQVPVVDEVLVALCTEQVDAQSCTSLRPDTTECDFAVVEGCVADDDGHGANYSPFHPGEARVGEPVDLHMCEWVEEYFAITLVAGTSLEIESNDEANGLLVELLELSTAPSGDTLMSRTSLGTPVSRDGTYLIAIESANAGDYRFTVVAAD